MNKDRCDQIMTWRYGLIAPALNHTHGFKSEAEYYRHLCRAPIDGPNSSEKIQLKPGTLKSWVHQFRKYGIKGITPVERSDYGKFRAINGNLERNIEDILTEYPCLTNTMVYWKLETEGKFERKVSQSTIDRYIRRFRKKAKLPQIHKGHDRHAWEMTHVNDLWQADTSYMGKINGHQTYLIAIVDDASRLQVGYHIYFNDNAINFQEVLKKAIATYGKPKILYVDNGSSYKNGQLNLICAHLQIQLLHTRVRDGASKGKVERSFNTHKRHWMETIDWNQFDDIGALNDSFNEYVTTRYNNAVHSALKDENGNPMTPKQRFMQDPAQLKYIDPDTLNKAFYHRKECKVYTDSTIRLQKMNFEVDSSYMGQTIEVHYNPTNFDEVWMIEDDKWIPIKPVNKKDNAKIKRKRQETNY